MTAEERRAERFDPRDADPLTVAEHEHVGPHLAGEFDNHPVSRACPACIANLAYAAATGRMPAEPSRSPHPIFWALALTAIAAAGLAIGAFLWYFGRGM